MSNFVPYSRNWRYRRATSSVITQRKEICWISVPPNAKSRPLREKERVVLVGGASGQ